MNTPYHTIARRALTLALSLALLITGLSSQVSTPQAALGAPAANDNLQGQVSALDFRNQMRKLWEDHIGWTRLYIISALADLQDKEAVAQRLLHNQDEIGDAIKPFYGEEAGANLSALLRDHIIGAAELLEAVKAGDNARIEPGKIRWYANAEDIAAFLDSANPTAWSRSMIASTMKMHLDLTIEEALARTRGDWAADVAAYDKIHEHILMMADALSAGIVSQFPDRFTVAPPDAQVTLRLNMRQAWEDHVIWTRLLIVSAIADLPDMEAALTRLLQNQVDIGNAVKPLYGDAAGDKLTALLKDHILGAIDLLMAAGKGDNAAAKLASDKWYANANDIAAFLNSANPTAWPLEIVKAEMKMHLDLTLEEAVAHMKGDYQTDIARYDDIHNHILDLADTLSVGIISQFPEQFEGASGSMPIGMPHTGHSEGNMALIWPLIIGGLVLVATGWYATKRRLLHQRVEGERD